MFIPTKKSLGQNFLKSKRVVDTIVDAGTVDTHDIVIEAGPGKGVMTEALLLCARQVIAIEKDARFVIYLNLKFKREIEAGKLKIISGDVLEFDPELENLQPGGYKIIANIPYYITGKFLKHFLSEVNSPSKMVLLLQREVVRRIIATDQKESILSISVKAYGFPKLIEKVPAEMFSPRPKVDSAVILIDKISKDFFRHTDERTFFEIVKTGFASKRKKLTSNLARLFPMEKVASVFIENDIDPNVRAEDLTLGKWKVIATALKKYHVSESLH